jgi:hypothetical protein
VPVQDDLEELLTGVLGLTWYTDLQVANGVAAYTLDDSCVQPLTDPCHACLRSVRGLCVPLGLRKRQSSRAMHTCVGGPLAAVGR